MGKPTHGMSKTSAYRRWRHMIERCENPNNSRYKDYGSRGIKVCERWHDFRNFFEDMGIKPDGLTLDRIDNDGNYELENCRWATAEEQQNNSRKLKWFYGHGPNGEMIVENNQSYVARVFGLTRQSISDCLSGIHKQHKSWTFQKI